MSAVKVREPLSARITQEVSLEIVGAVAKGARTWPEIRDALEVPASSILAQFVRSVLVAVERVELIAYDHPGGYHLTEDGCELAELAELVPSGEAPSREQLA